MKKRNSIKTFGIKIFDVLTPGPSTTGTVEKLLESSSTCNITLRSSALKSGKALRIHSHLLLFSI